MCINEEVVIFLKNEACAVIDAYKLIELSIKDLEVQIEQNSCAKKYRKELSKEIDSIRLNLEEIKEPIEAISKMLIAIAEAYLEVI